MLRETIEPRRAAWEQDLVAAMRRDEPDGYKEFFRCFRPLLIAEARRLRIQPALWNEMADECLDDVAMRLRRYTTPIPRSLAPYLVRALRIHRLALRREERRRADGERDGELSDNDPPAPLASALSQDTLRASAGPDGERTAGSTALERLASMVEEGLSREEELLLSWVSRFVPQSDVAQWIELEDILRKPRRRTWRDHRPNAITLSLRTGVWIKLEGVNSVVRLNASSKLSPISIASANRIASLG